MDTEPVSPHVSPPADHITTSSRDPGVMTDSLQQWMEHRVGSAAALRISDVSSPASNGMSSETLLFTARWDEGGAPVERRLVARIEPPATDYPVFDRYDLDMQFKVMRLVGEHTSVPIPETLWFEPDRAVLGGSFFVMARVEGQVPPDVLPYTFGDNWVFDADETGRHSIQESAVRALAGIHSVTPDRFDLDFLRPSTSGASSLERLLNHWKDYVAWVVHDAGSPLLEECLDWLDDRFPAAVGADALSWGDSRIGNMMFKDNELAAVLDWEMASVAPPEVDLGWMCYLHLFFQDLATDLGAPGLPSMFRPVEVAESYAKASGQALPDLTWHIAFAAIRHGAIMRRVAERAIHFGEAEMPDDIDDLIMHRATLRAMVDGTYWSTLAL